MSDNTDTNTDTDTGIDTDTDNSDDAESPNTNTLVLLTVVSGAVWLGGGLIPGYYRIVVTITFFAMIATFCGGIWIVVRKADISLDWGSDLGSGLGLGLGLDEDPLMGSKPDNPSSRDPPAETMSDGGFLLAILVVAGLLVGVGGLMMSPTEQVDKTACVEEEYGDECVEGSEVEYQESSSNSIRPVVIGLGGILVAGALVAIGVRN